MSGENCKSINPDDEARFLSNCSVFYRQNILKSSIIKSLFSPVTYFKDNIWTAKRVSGGNCIFWSYPSKTFTFCYSNFFLFLTIKHLHLFSAISLPPSRFYGRSDCTHNHGERVQSDLPKKRRRGRLVLHCRKYDSGLLTSLKYLYPTGHGT